MINVISDIQKCVIAYNGAARTEFGKSFIQIKNNIRPITKPCGSAWLPLRGREGDKVIEGRGEASRGGPPLHLGTILQTEKAIVDGAFRITVL